MSDTPIAIVTGASSGIGRAVAQSLHEAGYHVVAAARTESKLSELADELGGERVTVKPTDLADADQVTQLVESTAADLGRLDLLANVAGHAVLKPLADTSVDEWRECFEVNLTASFVATKAAWPTFGAQKSGLIVNFSSMASKDPFPGFGAYAAAKVGVNMLTLMTAREGEKIGVRSVCIAPGAVETPMLRGMFDEKAIPKDQALEPSALADLTVKLATGKREFQSGQTIFISK